MMRSAPTLARYLALAYGLLVLYASLYPITDWSQPAGPLLAYLSSPWPRYFTAFDIVTNVLGYLPLGFLLVPARPRRLNTAAGVMLAVVAAAALSFTIETLQNFLPARVPSNVDLGANTLGALLGVLLGLRWGDQFTDGGTLYKLRMRIFLGGKSGDVGLILLAAWLLAQFTPDMLLFGTGDLRRVLDLPSPPAFSAERFFAIEFGVAFTSVVAVGMTAATVVRGRRVWPIVMLLAAAPVVKALASGLLVSSGQYAYWITPGSSAGALVATLLTLATRRAPRWLQRSIAAVALLFATALVNMSPENPYVAASVSIWSHGHFLNFNGLTRLLSCMWPFAALSYLMAAGKPDGEPRRPDARTRRTDAEHRADVPRNLVE